MFGERPPNERGRPRPAAGDAEPDRPEPAEPEPVPAAVRPPDAIKGRGAAEDPPNRFLSAWVEPDPEWNDPDDPGPRTRFLPDASRSVVSRNDSPDIPFAASLNPYRGCENGCSYCYARPTHEYLGLSAGLDFETRIVVKERAPELLRAQLSARSWEPQVLALSGVTDAWQPVERRRRITRACLEVLAEHRNPVAVITKSALVTRDLDLLQRLAAHQAAAVNLSITSLDEELAGRLEPRAARPHRRLEAIAAMARGGVPVGVMVAPVIPGLNDHEVPAILEAARAAGAQWAGMILLRLPHGLRELFAAWLERHYPARKEKVLSRLREARGGQLNDPRFGSRMTGEGPYAQQIQALFQLHRRRLGFAGTPPLSTAAFRRPERARGQRQLFAD